LKEFSEFVASQATNSDHQLIVGDFNIHWDGQRNSVTKQLADILRFANLRHHVQGKKHIHSHILDLVISRDDENLFKGEAVSSMLSDHLLININVYLQKQSVSAKGISYRKYKPIGVRASSLALDAPDYVDYLVDIYNSTLRDIVDKHTPIRTRKMPRRPMLS